MYEIKIDGAFGECRIALLKDNHLLDAALWYPDFPDQWHDIHQVRIIKNMPSLGGAFVLLENGEEAFLTGLNKKNTPQEGTLIIAQIIRSKQNNKNLRLRPHPSPEQFSHISLTNKPQKIAQGPSPLEEFAKTAPQAPIIYHQASIGALVPSHLKPRLVRETESFNPLLLEEWEQLFEPTYSLDNILTAHITHTPALIAIDLDTASHHTHYKNDFERNLAAFPTLLRQIRLRNLSGTILIDPAGIKTRKRAALIPFIETLMKQEADPLAPHLCGITPSGLIEITRPHKRPSLYDISKTTYGKSYQILRTVLEQKPSNPIIYSTIEIIDFFKKNPKILEEFTLSYGHNLTFKLSQTASRKSYKYFSLDS